MNAGRHKLAAILLAAFLPALFAAKSPAQDVGGPPLLRSRPALPSDAASPGVGDDATLRADAIRLPRPRPDLPAEAAAALPEAPEEGERGEAGLTAEPAAPATARAALQLFAREPRPRPDPPSGVLALIAPGEVQEDPPAPLGPPIPAESEAEYAACLTRLKALDVAFTEEAPIDPAGGCHVEHPLNVTGIGSGISITPEAILNCRTTEALALWARDVMLPAAEEHLAAAPNKIVHGSAYVCRPRNNQAGAQLSEHATANAVDISSIGFADREPVNVGASSAKEEGAFENAIREGSCAYFTTVLGPGSNAAHATHFHFDMAERRGGYRLCELGEPRTADRAPGKT
jgi:hypothetical protein